MKLKKYRDLLKKTKLSTFLTLNTDNCVPFTSSFSFLRLLKNADLISKLKFHMNEKRGHVTSKLFFKAAF